MSALIREPQLRTGWRLKVVPAAFEAGGSLRLQMAARRGGGGAGPGPRPGPPGGVPGSRPVSRKESTDVDGIGGDAPGLVPSTVEEAAAAVRRHRVAEEAARRARAQIRRYGVANKLNRLGTLTYKPPGCYDPRVLRADVAAFFRKLRTLLGGRPLPYLWVPEPHPGGHGWHVHFVLGQYAKRSLIEQAWAEKGWVHITLIGDLPVGSRVPHEAAVAARYLSSYLSKDLRLGQGRLHRYAVARGFQPASRIVWGRTDDEALDAAAQIMGGDPVRVWRSAETLLWSGPPSVWASWL